MCASSWSFSHMYSTIHGAENVESNPPGMERSDLLLGAVPGISLHLVSVF
jgi:hypothetical protein